MIRINIPSSLFPGLCASVCQRKNCSRDLGSNVVPFRERHHTQRHQARKHFSGQRFSHQGMFRIIANGSFFVCQTTCTITECLMSILDCRPWFSHISRLEQTHKGGVAQEEPERAVSRGERCRHPELHGTRAPGEHTCRLHWEVRRVQLRDRGVGHPRRDGAVCKWVGTLNDGESFIFVTSCFCSDARSEDHICQCVRNGDRPAEDRIPADTPKQLIHLMKWCWHQNPQDRPTFQGTVLC